MSYCHCSILKMLQNSLPAKKLQLLIVFFATLLVSPLSLAEPKITTSFKYYKIKLHSVNSRSEISRVLSRASPIVTDGKSYRGRANWNVSWRYRRRYRNNYCYIEDISTTVNLVYTMPKAITLPKSKNLLDSYSSYYKALLLHEEGHGEIAVKGATAIEVQLGKMKRKGNCSKISKAANAKAHEILRIYKAANRAYDLRTEHGRTQGASIFAH